MPLVCASAGCPVVAVISQKGGAGKTTLARRFAVAAHHAGRVALVIDCGTQATASQWPARRYDTPLEVMDSPLPRLATKTLELLQRSAFVVFTAGPLLYAPPIYDEVGQVVAGYGMWSAPVILVDRAAFRHASATGTSVTTAEPMGKAGTDVRDLHAWTRRQLGRKTSRQLKVRS